MSGLAEYLGGVVSVIIGAGSTTEISEILDAEDAVSDIIVTTLVGTSEIQATIAETIISISLGDGNSITLDLESSTITADPGNVSDVTVVIDGEVSTIIAGETLVLIKVDIDIKPGSDPNSVNCKSKGNVPFAILSDENFDATTIPIELVSMSLVSSEPIQVNETHNQLHLEDVNGDGLLDGVLHIKTSDICLFIPDGTPIRSTIEITLSGETTDGQAFEGSDNIVLKGKKILEN